MKDEIGDRMKDFYEDRTRVYLPRRTYTIIRIDGKAFHTYTKGLPRPFDEALIQDMNKTAEYLCKMIQGAKLAYVQSDEISIIVTDFDNLTTSAWFDGNIQKMTSISASMATAIFNQLRTERLLTSSWKSYVYGRGQDDEPFFLKWDFSVTLEEVRLAHFDSRVFSIPSREEVLNYLIWRQQDATRNSISSVAQSLYSHQQLEGVTTGDMQELIFQKGKNWNDYPIGQKRGRIVLKNYVLKESTKERYDQSTDKDGWVVREGEKGLSYWVTRSVWTAIDPPIFTQEKNFLREIIPALDSE